MRRILTLAAACALLLAACGGDDDETSAGGGGGESQAEGPATIEVESSDLGDLLVDSEGNTLYMFMPDQQADGEPTCYDDCAEAWPAFEATGEQSAGEGLDQSLLGEAERTDGTTQVTYNDLPLYYFSGDEQAGDTNGQGLNDVWWVMSAEGAPIQDKKTSSDDDSSGDDGY
jgi:predicted lipoprotein with Yx(FWY)xxD motif